MNITVYLPDEIGAWAKARDLPLSRMLREAVEAERKQRDAASAVLGGSGVHELPITDDDGRQFTIRLHGAVIAGGGELRAFLGRDEQIFVYDSRGGGTLHYLDSPAELGDVLDIDGYIDAMHALGHRPVIDVGLPG